MTAQLSFFGPVTPSGSPSSMNKNVMLMTLQWIPCVEEVGKKRLAFHLQAFHSTVKTVRAKKICLLVRLTLKQYIKQSKYLARIILKLDRSLNRIPFRCIDSLEIQK